MKCKYNSLKLNQFYTIILLISLIKIILNQNYDYSKTKMAYQNIESSFMKLQYNNRDMIFLFDFGIHLRNKDLYYDGNDINTELIIETVNNNVYIICLSNNQILKIDKYDNTEKKIIDSDYQYNKYKCSITLYNLNNLIITNTYYDEEKKSYNNVIMKLDLQLNLIDKYNFYVKENLNNSSLQIIQCITIQSTLIYCAYVDSNTIIGFYMNDYFIKENPENLFDESLNVTNFKLFPFNGTSIILIGQNSDLDKLYINLITYSNEKISNKHLLILEEKTLDSLNSVSLQYLNEISFILLIINNNLKYFWINFSSLVVNYNYILMKNENFSKLKFGYVINIGNGIYLSYFGIENSNNKADIYQLNFQLPTQMMECKKYNLELISDDNSKFDITTILTNSIYQNTYLSINELIQQNGILVEFEDENKEIIKYSVGENGQSKEEIIYLFESDNLKIEYGGLNCVIIIKVCNDNCGTCFEFSNNNEEMKCITCKENYYLSYIKKDYCSTCYNENKENSLYSLWNYKNKQNECLYDNYYCSELISLNKPYMIYNTFECVESCPNEYKYYLSNYCIDECNKNNMKSNGVKCECENGYKILLKRKEKEIKCVLECEEEYYLYNNETNECVNKCPSNIKILFNNTCYNQCPIYTKQIEKNNLLTCECEYNSYEININNIKYIGCTTNLKCPQNMYNYNNSCVKKCPKFNDENMCYDICPDDSFLMKNECISKNKLIDNIDKNIKLLYLENNYIETNQLKIEIYNSSNENNKKRNISKIDLSECEKKIRKKYLMNDHDDLIILKIEIIREDNAINQIEYGIYNNKFEKINLKICSNAKVKTINNLNFSKINYKSMISLAEKGYDIFDPNDKFYTSVCTKYKSINGTDVINRDRRNDYYPNISLCEQSCKYDGLNFYNYTINCICTIKTDISLNLRDFSFNSIYETFQNALNPANLKIIKCFKEAFNIHYFYLNYGQIFSSISIVLEIILTILFIKFGIENLLNLINEIIIEKNIALIKSKNEKNNNLKSIEKISNPPKKNINPTINIPNDEKIKIKTPNSPPVVYNNQFIQWFKNSPYYQKKCDNTSNTLSSSNNMMMKNDDSENENITEKIDKILNTKHINLINYPEGKLQTKSKLKSKRNKIKSKKSNRVVFFGPQVNVFIPNNNAEQKFINILNPLSNSPQKLIRGKNKTNKKISLEEISLLGFKNSIKYDKSSFCEYYWFLLKYHQLIIFTFITKSDNNLKIIKISLFIFSLNLYLVFSTIFFNDSTFTYVYKHNGKFNFLTNIPKSIFSSACCTLIKSLLNKLSLSQTIIQRIQIKTSFFEASYLFNKVRHIILSRIKIFYIILYILLIVCWYYISVFCGVYRNTQNALFKSTLQSFFISMIYPFIFCFLTNVSRKIALKYKSKCLFKFSCFLNNF